MEMNEIVDEVDQIPAPPPTPELPEEISVVSIPAEDLAAALSPEGQAEEVPRRTSFFAAAVGNIDFSGKWMKFKRVVYDPRTKKIFGRTAVRWLKLALFYAMFYSVLASIFAVGVHVLLNGLEERHPKFMLRESLIGNNPGLGFRPIHIESGALIKYTLDEPKTAEKWVEIMDTFLKPYKNLHSKDNVKKCTNRNPTDNDTVCLFEINQFGPCSTDRKYGYPTSSPCVFIKLNKIFGWIPKLYTEPVKGMPQDLNKTILALPERKRNQIWISCNGETSEDRKNFFKFEYYPAMGFPAYFYPYLNTKNYLSPLIAVQILKVKPNVLINIECRAWAKNIFYSNTKNKREGSVHFEIFIEK